ncbi:MAG: crossover junction endodeoxyribonuclease RuvC [Clostridia bacterium]|nr:crossover junction endodeoxyribonuclease RuvC [Clostridia bacterium]
MIVLGIDPGYGIVGFGVIESTSYGCYTVVDYGVITTPKENSITERLSEIYESIIQLIDAYKPDCVAIEELFFNTNTTTAINVAQARGVILLACKQKLDDLYEYTPLQIKQAITGNGRAEKKQMQLMVQAILGLEKLPRPDDAADALAVAICHTQTNNLIKDNRI